MKKLQEAYKNTKLNVEELTVENLSLSAKFDKMKQLVINYEHNRIK